MQRSVTRCRAAGWLYTRLFRALDRLTTGTTALAVAIAAFFVAFPEGTHLVAKRIALGQIVLTYVMGFVNGEHSGAVMLPVRVAASTAIGVLACVLALLLPYPRLACYEVKWNCKQLADNASERLRLYVKALCAEDKSTALASISLAKSLTKSGTKHIQNIKRYQDSPQPSVLPRQERQLSKVANVKALGTVLGTVYGVLGCFLFEKLLPIRFLFLFPWFIFTSFLRHGRMYGQGGGISAVIGAVLILGRKSFGPPEEFAIARIVETFIGLTCTIIGELLFQSTRASTLAKSQLSKSLGTLHDCISSMTLRYISKRD
ncbi:p-hydroxybenzoic acid efflux pump subunit [Citrus sinensis]|nr:p-hydroxybenzoic acid efflux pump subunit [Citrus sinensis]